MAMNTELAFPKPEPRARTKGRKDRAEAKVKTSVRAQCVDRDYTCRVGFSKSLDVVPRSVWDTYCEGPDQWAHLHSHRRSQTRGQAATKRHTTAGSLILCAEHHQQYDAHQLRITALTRKGADGPLKFSRAK